MEREVILSRGAAGESFASIADRLGRTKGAIEVAYYLFGGRPRKNHREWTPAEDAQLLELAADGRSFASITRELDRHPEAIRRRYAVLGGPRRETAEVRSAAARKRGKKTRRACLRCEREFVSSGISNRICPECREKNARVVVDNFDLASFRPQHREAG
jgi:hypothetical protein